MNARKTSAIRWMLSLFFGCLVTAVAFTSVGGARSRDMRFEQRNTRFSLLRIDVALANYYSQSRRYPEHLAQSKRNWRDEADGWQRDWIYSISYGKPLVESLGRDGQRGGIGIDADLSNRNPRPPQMRMPFWARVSDEDARMTVVSAIFCGLLASVIMLGALEKATFAAREWLILAPALLMSFAVAALGAAFITLLHIPSGGH